MLCCAMLCVFRCVLTAAQLLSEGLAERGGFASGFDWAAEQLRQAGYDKLAAEVRHLWFSSRASPIKEARILQSQT